MSNQQVSAERPNSKTVHWGKVPGVSRDEAEAVLESGRGDQGVRKTDAAGAADPTSALGNACFDLPRSPERGKQLSCRVGNGRTCEELRAGDHAVMEPVFARLELVCAPQVIDEDVGVDKNVSHVPTRRG